MATITKDVYTHSGLAPLPLVINSLYASEMGFRLAFELLNDSNQVIYKGSLSPDSTGDMTIDLLPILKYYVKPHEFNDVGGIANAADEVFKYKYRTQESYIQSSLATDWLYVTPWANENKTVIEFDVAHHFTVADVGTYITISVSNTYPDGSVQQSLSGNWILTDIISPDRIAIALPFPGSGLGFSALVYSASQIRTTRPAVTSSTKYLYNYTLTYDEQMNCATKDNNLLSFLSTSNSVKLLSSHIYPAPRDLYSWQNEYVTILDPNGAVNKVRFTSDNCVLEKTVGVFDYKSIKISNLVDTEYTLVSGELPLIDCNTKYYDVEFLDGSNQVLNVDYLNSCNSTFQIGNYDCIDAIENIDNVIQIDIQVPTGTTISVPSPFTLSLDGTLYSQSVVIDDEVILYVNLNSADTGQYLETITFKNGWHMECRCICAVVNYSDSRAEFIVSSALIPGQSPCIINVSDVSDLGSAEAIQLPAAPGSSFAQPANKLIYCNGKWFGVNTPTSSRLWISEDGAQTWTYVTRVTDGNIDNIYFINNEYVMYVMTSTSDDKYVSSDGLTWVSSSMRSERIKTTKYKDNKLVIIWNDVIWKSLDGGLTWTTLTNPTAGGSYSVYFDWDGDCWFIYSYDSVHKSLDGGLTWGSVDINADNNTSFAKMMPNGQFIVCAPNKIFVSNKTTSNTSWTTVDIPGRWMDVASNGNSIILVGYHTGGSVNTMAMTTDMMGTSGWTGTATNTTLKTGFIKSHGSQYIMIATLPDNTTVLRRSDDGISWFDYTITPNVPLPTRTNTNTSGIINNNYIEFRP